MNKYEINKTKNNILKKLQEYWKERQDYKTYNKENRTDEEWFDFCQIITEIKSDEYINGIEVNPENSWFELIITSKGTSFINNGGYPESEPKQKGTIRKNIYSIIIFLAAIATIISVIYLLFMNK